MHEPVTLDGETFRAIGRRWTGVRTAISPLESGAAPIPPSGQQQLRTLGLIDAGGHPTPKLNGILSVLGRADAVVDLVLLAGGEEIRHAICFSSAGPSPVLVTTVGDTVTVHPAGSPDLAVNDLAARMPSMPDAPAPFSADLLPQDARILAALLDLQRQSALAAAAAQPGAPAAPVVFYPFEIEEILQEYIKSPPSWLLLSMVSTLTEPASISGEDIGRIFSRLVSRGHLTRSGQGYIFQQTLLNCANRLLSPGYVLLCTSRTLGPASRVSKAEVNCIGFDGGILSLISGPEGAGTLSIRTMALESVLDIVRRLAVSPNLSAAAAGLPDVCNSPPPQPLPSVRDGSFCPACGAPAGPGAKFCRSCGAPLGQPPAPAACPACHQPVRPGAKFCKNCGTKIG